MFLTYFIYRDKNTDMLSWYSYTVIQANLVFSSPVSDSTCIGKLFPPSTGYIGCSSARSVKVVHNAVMTLVCFPFDLADARNLHKKVEDDPVPTRLNLCAKITLKSYLAWLICCTTQWGKVPRDQGRLHWWWWHACLTSCCSVASLAPCTRQSSVDVFIIADNARARGNI